MSFSSQIVLPLVAVSGIAVFAIFRMRRINLHLQKEVADGKDHNVVFITQNSCKVIDRKDIISELQDDVPQVADRKDIISELPNDVLQVANRKEIISELPDIISELPDDVLISIISRLPTKPSIRTSILSKQWINLYKHVLDIAITCRDFHGPRSFVDHDSNVVSHVERFLRLRSDTGSKIRSFRLGCFLSKSYSSRLKQCIYSLGKLGVEQLVLHFSPPTCGVIGIREYISVCDILVETQSLKYFELDSCSLQPNLKSQCNSLQTLCLTRVAIYPGALDCILSNCLSLCSLSMNRCKCPSKLCFKGLNLQLKSLVVEHCLDVKEMELYASNLIEFKFQASRFINFTFDHVPLLQSILVDSIDDMMISYVFGGLSRDLPHLQSLAASKFGEMRLRNLWTERFGNLRRLEMGVNCTNETNLLETNLLELASFMGSCPVLQELYLSLFHDICPLLPEFYLSLFHDIEQDAYSNGEEGIVHLELKKVEIHGFKMTRRAMGLASYLLKTAINLEQMRLLTPLLTPRRDCECSLHYACPKHTNISLPWHKMIEKRLQKIENQLQSRAVSSTTQVVAVVSEILVNTSWSG